MAGPCLAEWTIHACVKGEMVDENVQTPARNGLGRAVLVDGEHGRGERAGRDIGGLHMEATANPPRRALSAVDTLSACC